MIWDFFQRYDESWIWRCADHSEVTESRRNFAALEECIEDAVEHGYCAPGRKTDGAARSAAKRRRRKTSRPTQAT